MKTLLFNYLALGVQLFSSTTAVEEELKQNANKKPSVVCQFGGEATEWSGVYQFNIDHIRDGLCSCDIIIYGTFFPDLGTSIKTFVADRDKEVIKMITDEKRTVYISLNYINDSEQWSELMVVVDEERFNCIVDALITFCNDYGVTGIVFTGASMYEPNTTSTPENIAAFASKLKKLKNGLRVSIFIDAFDFKLFTDQNAFDYTITNQVLDYYFIDTTISNFCTPRTKVTSVNPIRSKSDDILTLESQTIAVKNSKMKQSKVFLNLQVSALLSTETYKPNDRYDVVFASYAQVCSFEDISEKKKFCTDYMAILYDQGKYASENYAGIVLSMMEGDDFNQSCTCPQLFPVSNAIISGWYNSDAKCCNNIDLLMTLK